MSHPEAQQSPHFTSEYACLLVFFFERAVSRHTHKHTHTKRKTVSEMWCTDVQSVACNSIAHVPLFAIFLSIEVRSKKSK